jgi:hypothetical protein
MTAATDDRAEFCWTESYALRHCEGYRVIGPEGGAGYVDEVWTYEDGDVATLVVAGEKRQVVLAADVDEVDDRREILRVRRLRDPDGSQVAAAR